MPKTENERGLTIPPMIDLAQIPQSNSLTKPQRILNSISSSRSVLVAVVYLLLLAFAEFLVILDAPLLGMLLYGLILVALLLHVFLGNQPSQSPFLLALSLAPLIRLLSLMMPLAHFPIVYCYVIVGVPLFVAIFLLTRLIGINRHMVGLVLSSFPLQLLVGLSGIILGYVEYIILRPTPSGICPSLGADLVARPNSSHIHWFTGRAYLSRLAAIHCPHTPGALLHSLCSGCLRCSVPGLSLSIEFGLRFWCGAIL